MYNEHKHVQYKEHSMHKKNIGNSYHTITIIHVLNCADDNLNKVKALV